MEQLRSFSSIVSWVYDFSSKSLETDRIRTKTDVFYLLQALSSPTDNKIKQMLFIPEIMAKFGTAPSGFKRANLIEKSVDYHFYRLILTRNNNGNLPQSIFLI